MNIVSGLPNLYSDCGLVESESKTFVVSGILKARLLTTKTVPCRNVHSSPTCYRILARAQTDSRTKILPARNKHSLLDGLVHYSMLNIHFSEQGHTYIYMKADTIKKSANYEEGR